MQTQRENLEQQALVRFEEVAHKYHCRVFKGQGLSNRIPVDGSTYFQFGDLRVATERCYVVIEVESAGGVTNLVKYWHTLEKSKNTIDKPVILLHVFRQISRNDYAAHLALWDFLWGKMSVSLGETVIRAARYTYRELHELEPVVKEFEKYLQPIPS